MEPHIPIENLLLLNDGTAEARKNLQATFVAALEEIKGVDAVRTGEDDGGCWVRFYCEWEPPFKQLKQISKEHPEVSCVLLSDAFAKSHWLSKAHYVAGKGAEQTVSRVDDNFNDIFQEVFGKDPAIWQAEMSPFPRYE